MKNGRKKREDEGRSFYTDQERKEKVLPIPFRKEDQVVKEEAAVNWDLESWVFLRPSTSGKAFQAWDAARMWAQQCSN